MKSFATFLAGTALALCANAATVSFNFGSPTLGLQTTEINQSGVLGLFNSSLGTLTGVSFSVSGAESTSLSLTNGARGPQTTTAFSTVELTFGSTLGALNVLLLNANPFILSASPGSVTLAAGTTQSFGPLTNSFTNTPVNVSGIQGSFANVGGGTFNVGCTSLSGLSLRGGGGNISSTQATQAACGAQVVYTFTPTVNRVPEPGSLALFGAALAGLALVRRKSQKA